MCLWVTLQFPKEGVALGKCVSISLLNWFCLLVRARPRSPECLQTGCAVCLWDSECPQFQVGGGCCLPACLSRQRAFDCSFHGVWYSEPNRGLILLRFGLNGWVGGRSPGLCRGLCLCLGCGAGSFCH